MKRNRFLLRLVGFGLTTAKPLPLAQGGGDPSPISLPVAPRPPPQPPDDPDPLVPPPEPPPLSRFVSFFSTLKTPNSNSHRVLSSGTLNADIHCTPVAESARSVLLAKSPDSLIQPRSLLHRSSLRSDLTHPCFSHFFSSTPPPNSKSDQHCDDRLIRWGCLVEDWAATVSFSSNREMAAGDVMLTPRLCALTGRGNENLLHRRFRTRRLERKPPSVGDVSSMNSTQKEVYLKYPYSVYAFEKPEVNAFLGLVIWNTLVLVLQGTWLVEDSEIPNHHTKNQIPIEKQCNICLLVSPLPSAPSLLGTQTCIANMSCIWSIVPKLSSSGQTDKEESGKTLDVGSDLMLVVRKDNIHQGGARSCLIALVEWHEESRIGQTHRPPAKPPDRSLITMSSWWWLALAILLLRLIVLW